MILRKAGHLFGWSSRKPIFVIGTGRSGTHWLGYSLDAHPEVYATIETEPMFSLSTRIALNEPLEKTLFPKLSRAYKWQLCKAAPRRYLDKTHPNIWIAEKLLKVFPAALFVGIERNPYATVASMIRHRGVASWHARWREFPVPNRFLGITEALAEGYADLSLATQCALRWRAHHERMNELKRNVGDALHVICYETFARDPKAVTEQLQLFLQLKEPIPVPEVKLDSLEKWRSQLSDQDIIDIEQVVGVSPLAAELVQQAVP